MRWQSEQLELYVFDVASGRERHLTAAMPPARYYPITWADHGLYVITDRERDRGALCRMDVETAELTELVAADDLLSNLGGLSGEIDFDIGGQQQCSCRVCSQRGRVQPSRICLSSPAARASP